MCFNRKENLFLPFPPWFDFTVSLPDLIESEYLNGSLHGSCFSPIIYEPMDRNGTETIKGQQKGYLLLNFQK